MDVLQARGMVCVVSGFAFSSQINPKIMERFCLFSGIQQND
jgi:hypothetical protein